MKEREGGGGGLAEVASVDILEYSITEVPIVRILSVYHYNTNPEKS